jgi:PAS domain S-box-containing protein
MKIPDFNPVLIDLLKENLTDKKLLETIKQCFDFIDYLFIVISPEGEIICINRQGSKILGYKENQLINQILYNRCFKDDEVKTVKSAVNDIISGKISSGTKIKVAFLNKNGDQRIIESNFTPVKDKESEILGITITGNEISEIEHYNQKLKDSYRLYKTLTETLPDINLYLFNDKLTFLIADGNDMQRHGFPNSSLKGKNIYDVWDMKLRNKLIPFFRSALKGKDISTEFGYNKTFYYLWVSPLKNDKNEIYAGAALLQNITEDKKNLKKLNKAKELAEDANKSKSEFLTNITHEIRTPLNAIVGFTEQLLKSRLNEHQKIYANIIDKSSEHLLSLVNDLLVMSRIEAGKIRFESEPFKIETIIKEIYNSLKIRADEKQINFKYDVHEKLNRVIIGDPFRLKQILLNILSNAIKFTGSGYVELKCFPMESSEEEIKVRMDIIDTGPGIPEGKIDTIFDQFRQADSAASKIYGGTGLGLTISKRLTELQGGKISVKSKEGLGTRFTLILSYRPGNENDFVPDESHAVVSDALRNLSVLLVDDDSVNRLLGKIILEDFGCQVDIAVDGREAMEKVDMHKFDIILLDILMPEFNGYEVADYIRNKKKDKEVKIIAVTAAVLKEDINKFKRSGIDDYLIKPFREINLYNIICKTLNINKQPIQLTKAEIILKEEEKEPLFNLYELKRITKGNKEIFVKMVNTFIVNASDAIQSMHKNLKNNNWKKIGETAHKIIPSYKHLDINTVVSDLMELKIKTLIAPDYEDVPELINSISKSTKKVINLLKQEIIKENSK